MSPRDRVRLALNFQEPDIVPYHVSLTSEAHQRLVDHHGGAGFEDLIGNHIAEISLRELWPDEETQPGFFRDEWGVTWNRTVDKDIGVVHEYLLPGPSLEGYEFPNPDPAPMSKAYQLFIERNPDKFRVACLGFAIFERAWALRGFDNTLADMLESPRFLHELLDRLVEWSLVQVDLAVKHDLDCIRFGDDWGSQTAMLMGPELWRKFIKPPIAKICEHVRSAGKFMMIHSCGDVRGPYCRTWSRSA